MQLMDGRGCAVGNGIALSQETVLSVYQRSLSCGEYSTAIVSRAWTVRRQCGPKRIRKFYADGRKMSGSSELGLELTDIVINERSYPLLAAMYEIKGSGEGSKTTRKVLGGAGLSALIGGTAGGGRGAGIGALAGAGAGTAVAATKKGQQISIPSESLIEFQLTQPVTLPVAR